MAGRPTKLDDLVSRRICDALRRGASRSAAFASVCSLRAPFDWIARGKEGEEPFAQFLHRVEEAEAQAELCVSDKAYELAVAGDRVMIEKWLERRRPLEWAKREVTAADEQIRAEAPGDSDLAVVESLMAALKSRAAG